ncbi:Fatty acyl-CoA elongase/Polyunsaturated fatty acid specific elongation enzyme [Lodderomyces elongisporus]|uniref:Fatty acyl-CoA elongase/Polyunsaturated fatty acid specific elongation enzyme n=1 Tax=Lodderomyces elongisporus TaxID=36914 RepID=UPI0029266310|nr:Fatty acyl-CoA elongase/Polyunsaturated fatty acid specific elongation enzyme [Lodderomyces elongisporus]WLF79307.1 Fatty acyl-CoA elongase/Polyunsaturated fatty acid specific elongation enzyme [Lodderomyces elongisporus]
MTFPTPSWDTPFGVKLWPIFNELVSKATGDRFVPSKFQFVEGELPFSTFPPVALAITTYYIVIFGGNYIFKKFGIKPFVLNGLFQIHNLFLTTLSLTLLTLMVEQLVPMIYHHGIFYAICSTNAWTQELVCLYYLNYITKFLEFIDTVFLVVKQKKLTFLHTYHHGATALLCYTQLIGVTSISWVPISLNLGVHVVMYWYYFLAARGIRVWWKEWVTRFQIIQFVLDLGFVYFASYQKIVFTYFGKHAHLLPVCGDCAGTMLAAYSGCAILSSYLVLFIAFYIDVYRKSSSKKAKIVKSVKGGVAAQVNEYVYVSGRSATPVPAPEVGGARQRKA